MMVDSKNRDIIQAHHLAVELKRELQGVKLEVLTPPVRHGQCHDEHTVSRRIPVLCTTLPDCIDN
eukprot:m.446386 g.446386  ORF g.446386 m.446386 type:complete len:65 (-) comp19352_c0_seq1:282-476(-)